MKKNFFTAIVIIVLIASTSCNSNATAEKENEQKATASNSTPATQNDGIVGEWEQQYTCFDKNGNYKLETEEKTPSNNTVGFNWFQFNADGTCLRDKEMKFKSTYEIKDNGENKEIIIQNVHGYTIVEQTEKELILGAEGAFMVFKRI